MSSFNPFGEVSCELEKRKFGGQYSEYFFEETPFNRPALDPETYLIIGRRGSGKTSLGEYFGFQSHVPDTTSIDVNEPGVYNAILNQVIRQLEHPSELAIPLIKDIWEFTIWQLVFQRLRGRRHGIRLQSIVEGDPGSASSLLRSIFSGILEKYLVGEKVDMSSQIAGLLNGGAFRKAREVVLNEASRRPVIVAIDCMEHYSVEDTYVMWATAGLVECASYLNAQYASSGFHVKVFIPDEVFPYLQENVITNVSKHVRNPLFLHWRPRDLARLVCWRFFKFLSQSADYREVVPADIDWSRYRDVVNKIWKPYFGEDLTDGITEHTFPYVLRHTQMRPRQLVMLCNRVAAMAAEERVFPRVPRRILKAAVRQEQLQLANEVVSSYSRIWPSAGQIIGALSGMPARFPGRELDRVAKRTAAEWPVEYSRSKFKRLVTELGIVGRQRREPGGNNGIVEADFEFLLEDRLYITERDVCVVHPMFYRKLNIQREREISVYPFPDHPDYHELQQMATW